MGKETSFFIRMALPSDVAECHEIDVEAWGEEASASPEMLQARIQAYPCGNFVAIDIATGTMIGSVWSVSVRDKPFTTWLDTTGDGTYCGVSDYGGDVVFGVNVSARKKYAGLGTAQTLLAHGCGVARGLGKRGAKMGCRLPEYHRWQNVFVAADYVHVRRDDGNVYFHDMATGVTYAGPSIDDLLTGMQQVDPRSWQPIASFPSGVRPLDGELAYFMDIVVHGSPCKFYALMPGYFPDPESCDNGALIGWEWEPIIYTPTTDE